jgi:WD40 repeat protein
MTLGKSLSVAYSRDGQWLAALTERSVRVLSAVDVSERFAVKVKNPSDVRFSPNTQGFLVKTTSGRISWHAIDGSDSKVIRKNDGEGPAPVFATNKQFLNARWDGSVEVIDLDTERSLPIQSFEGEMIAAIHRLADGAAWLFLHSPRATADDRQPEPCYFSRWTGEVPSRNPRLVQHGLRFIKASAPRPSGELLAVVHGAPPNELAIVGAQDSTIHAKRTIDSGGTGSELAWSSDGRRLAVIEDHAARVYDQGLELLEEFPLRYASSVAFAPDGRALAIGSWEKGAVVQV